MVDCCGEVRSGEKKVYVLGRREAGGGGVLDVGRYHALDGSAGARVGVDALHPHVALICGKRGYGKSYTIGVFVEELARLEEGVRRRLGVVVVDTLGVFWTMGFSASGRAQVDEGLTGVPLRVLVPGGAVDELDCRGVSVVPFAVRANEVPVEAWCRLFGVSPLEPVGVVVGEAVEAVRGRSGAFSVEDLVSWLDQSGVRDSVVRAARGLFVQAASWGVFGTEGASMDEVVRAGEVSVLDLSRVGSLAVKDVVVALIADKIFDARVAARRGYERERLGLGDSGGGMPMVWLVVDEAQVFVPREGVSRCREVLVGKWLRQGRQPGLSLVLATQRPCAVDEEVFAHCDLVICHRLTAREDVEALGRIRPEYLVGDLGGMIRQLGMEKGVAVMVDDTSESAHIVRIRQRLTWHAGEESLAMDPMQARR